MSLAQIHALNSKDPIWRDRLLAIVQHISAIEQRAKILVFGSFVENKMTAASDLDLAVLLPDDVTIKEFLRSVRANGAFCDWPVDIVALSISHFNKRKDFGGVCVSIKHSGIEIYPNWSLK